MDANAQSVKSRAAGRRITRRQFIAASGTLAAAAALAPRSVLAGKPGGGAGGLVDPYGGIVPLTSPLVTGTFVEPLADNWHQPREGSLYTWSHRNSNVRRAHDGVDMFPVSGQPLPLVYAPLSGTVAAVCTRPENTIGATVTYRVDANAEPLWDYSQATDDVAGLPLYGNFIWLRSTGEGSAGYFVFFCHLQNDAVLQAINPGQAVTLESLLGTVGETGNAVGSPQLHVEIHYPAGATFACRRCRGRARLTSINPFASLASATPRGPGG